jgi:hypothetical protein
MDAGVHATAGRAPRSQTNLGFQRDCGDRKVRGGARQSQVGYRYGRGRAPRSHSDIGVHLLDGDRKTFQTLVASVFGGRRTGR